MSRGNGISLNQVVINEFELNPNGRDGSLFVSEWVELFNPTAISVDIGGWTLSTTHGKKTTVTIPPGTIIEANGYYVYQRILEWLYDTEESIILETQSGVEVDRTPIMSDKQDDEYCWARVPNGYDTNSSSDWVFQTATKGASNGKGSSSISCILSSTSLKIGSNITVSGIITPPHTGVIVKVNYTMPNSTIITRTAISNSSGGYTDTYAPLMTGSWSVSSSWDGDENHSGASSEQAAFSVSKLSSSITCEVSSSSIFIGDTVIVHGAINASVSAEVTLETSTDDGITWDNLTTVTTSSNGTYLYDWTPTSVGSYYLKASWLGNDMYYEAFSDKASVTITITNASITCSLSEASITYGSSVTISGNLTDALTSEGLPGRKVNIEYSTDSGISWGNITDVSTETGGAYSHVWSPNHGSYMIRTVWYGDDAYKGATSSSVELLVEKATSEITCILSSTIITLGNEITVSGFISPPLSGKTVTLTYKRPDGSFLLRTVTTEANSSYSDRYKPEAIGYWGVLASWSGDENHEGATSWPKSFAVTKIFSSISCSVSSSEVTEGGAITVSGSIFPSLAGRIVILAFTKPDASSVNITLITASDGSFTYTFTPDVVGTWSVKAWWMGDQNYMGDTSLTSSFVVIKSVPTIFYFEAISDGVTHQILIESNSTISDFDFNPTQISFNVTGPTGNGVSNVTIPKQLVPEGYTLEVHLNGELHPFTMTENTTHYHIYLTYTHSPHEVTINIIDAIYPIADAGPDRTVNVNTQVNFDGFGSSDNVGIITYFWDFGDGTKGTGSNTTHSYTQPGTYTVTLRVKDTTGNEATSTLTVIVKVPFLWWTAGVVMSVTSIVVGGIAVALVVFVMLKKPP